MSKFKKGDVVEFHKYWKDEFPNRIGIVLKRNAYGNYDDYDVLFGTTTWDVVSSHIRRVR